MKIKRMKTISLTLAVSALAVLSSLADARSAQIEDGELWWGAANFFGTNMPFSAKTRLTVNLKSRNYSNQCASLLLSDHGRVIWSEGQSVIAFKDGAITMDADAPVAVETASEPTLSGAYRHAMRKWFPPSGKTPDLLFFTAPQLNTWIELTYHQNQKDILAYARSMLDHGVPPGVFMIDDTWQAGYGDWRFEPSRFPNPKEMVDSLHAMGYKVMLWMCPYVGMDTPAFRRIAWGRNPDDVRGYPAKGGFLTEPTAAKPGEGEYNFKTKPKATSAATRSTGSCATSAWTASSSTEPTWARTTSPTGARSTRRRRAARSTTRTARTRSSTRSARCATRGACSSCPWSCASTTRCTSGPR